MGISKLSILFVATIVALNASVVQAEDVDGSSDHPLIGRFDGSSIHAYQDIEFAEVRFRIGDGSDEFETKEGALTRIHYKMPSGVSVAQAFRNFADHLDGEGFEVVFSCVSDGNGRNECGIRSDWADNFPIDQRHLYVDAFNYRVLTGTLANDMGKTTIQILASQDGEVRVLVTALEEKALQGNMVDATAIQEEVSTNGRIALYGITFDTDSSVIKPESIPTLIEMAQFLKTNGDLDVIIVGHTDSQGSMDYNLALSTQRAQAIRDALISDFGIEAGRIEHAGVGFLAPVASNVTTEGRTLNRRVEVVAR